MTLSCRDDSHEAPCLPFGPQQKKWIEEVNRLLANAFLPDHTPLNIRVMGKTAISPTPGIEIDCSVFEIARGRAGEAYISALTRLIQPSRFNSSNQNGVLYRDLIFSTHDQSAHARLETMQKVRKLFPSEDPIWQVPALLGGVSVVQTSITTSIRPQ